MHLVGFSIEIHPTRISNAVFGNTICPPEDEHDSARNMYRNVINILKNKEFVHQVGKKTVIMLGSTVNRILKFTLYMFRTVSPSIIRNLRLYIQHQVYVIQVLWLFARGH